jgi:NADPH:quinone reductase-like Zn-dependent oxidoreductase
MNNKTLKMKAVVCEKYGGPEVLRIKEIDRPIPGENEVLIRQIATSVSSWDVKLRKGSPWVARLFNGITRPNRNILGSAISGVVEAIGNNVAKYKVRDRVFGYCESGAYAEYISQPEDGSITRLPEDIGFEEAAALPFGGLSALYFLRKGEILAGQNVLVYGASGSVGSMAVQLAKHFGAKVTGVSSTSSVKLVKSLGADETIDYTTKEFPYTIDKFDLIFDTVHKYPYSRCEIQLKPNGTYVTTGIDLGILFQMSFAKMRGNRRIVAGIARERMEDLEFMKELLHTRDVAPIIDSKYPLDSIAEAHAYVEKGHKKGDVLITF